MSNTFITSDLHLGHKGIITFLNGKGERIRPFDSIEEHDAQIVSRWNAKVKPQDKVYVLGDVVINRKFLPILDTLNGSKRLIRGNHDIFPTKDYMKYFKEIYGVRVLSDMILSHIPLMRESITKRFGTNVHGHLHANDIADGAYLCVSMEHTDFQPISIDEIRERIKKKREQYPNPIMITP